MKGVRCVHNKQVESRGQQRATEYNKVLGKPDLRFYSKQLSRRICSLISWNGKPETFRRSPLAVGNSVARPDERSNARPFYRHRIYARAAVRSVHGPRNGVPEHVFEPDKNHFPNLQTVVETLSRVFSSRAGEEPVWGALSEPRENGTEAKLRRAEQLDKSLAGRRETPRPIPRSNGDDQISETRMETCWASTERVNRSRNTPGAIKTTVERSSFVRRSSEPVALDSPAGRATPVAD